MAERTFRSYCFIVFITDGKPLLHPFGVQIYSLVVTT